MINYRIIATTDNVVSCNLIQFNLFISVHLTSGSFDDHGDNSSVITCLEDFKFSKKIFTKFNLAKIKDNKTDIVKVIQIKVFKEKRIRVLYIEKIELV